ncbi:DNA adenine methylase [Flavobacteriales bacterium]|nr:DNA adenine methylase [Flavobacteriales bacterium]
MNETNIKFAKPFLKWAGGKTQLLEEIRKSLPENFEQKETFIEPFVGSGAVLFWMLANYPSIKKAVINDVNADLIITYKAIKNNVSGVVSQLKKWEAEYHQFKNDADARKVYYYEKRTLFNSRSEDEVIKAALFIFLNRTCFNGLYRVNKSNGYNVPIGSYKTPMICDMNNLYAVSEILQRVEILNGDFEETIQHVKGQTFFYFDPPYKPLSDSSSFNSYAKGGFNDPEQIRLRDYCTELHNEGHSWLLSNSDVKGWIEDGDFFDNLYGDYSISRVLARRAINSKSDGRGKLNELLIRNY